MRSVSTRSVWAYVKIERAAGPGMTGRQGRRRRTGAPQAFDRRVRTIQVKWRGGAEAWWAINDGRGWMLVAGHECLHDALAELLGVDTQ